MWLVTHFSPDSCRHSRWNRDPRESRTKHLCWCCLLSETVRVFKCHLKNTCLSEQDWLDRRLPCLWVSPVWGEQALLHFLASALLCSEGPLCNSEDTEQQPPCSACVLAKELQPKDCFHPLTHFWGTRESSAAEVTADICLPGYCARARIGDFTYCSD